MRMFSKLMKLSNFSQKFPWKKFSNNFFYVLYNKINIFCVAHRPWKYVNSFVQWPKISKRYHITFKFSKVVKNPAHKCHHLKQEFIKNIKQKKLFEKFFHRNFWLKFDNFMSLENILMCVYLLWGVAYPLRNYYEGFLHALDNPKCFCIVMKNQKKFWWKKSFHRNFWLKFDIFRGLWRGLTP